MLKLKTRLKNFLSSRIDAAVSSSIHAAVNSFFARSQLLNKNQQPTGSADKIMIRYLSLNNKALAHYIAEELKKEIAKRPIPESPGIYHLNSKVSTQEDIESDWSRYWIRELGKDFNFHRKNWEQSYVLQVLFEHGMLQEGKKGLGLGCGREPLPSYLIKRGCEITAGDKPGEDNNGDWVKGGQYTESLSDLFYEHLVDITTFKSKLELRYVDLTQIPPELFGLYDFCWSVCVIEHIGSIQAGLDFLKNSLNLLKPGGISVHTTEFNFLDTPQTIDNCGSVLFKKEHIEYLVEEIGKLGGEVIGADFSYGNKIFDLYIDNPPYFHQEIEGINIKYPPYSVPHIKLLIDGFPATCFGVIIKKKAI
ncbi:hypothetical protein [Desulfovibrio sp. ZJ200]|uniref:hypothetical protein n=1 Tax=Desulfovibrio sp. ZJ200 TaxID=2709792 RepID=UPI0013E9D681|nr:hypothetical protein [Desulfovibrio sp. ZJ200]